MQIVIDISDTLKRIADEEDAKTFSHLMWQAILMDAIKNGTPIPDNDCDNCEKAWTDKCERAECYENNYKHWTPYQKGGKG